MIGRTYRASLKSLEHRINMAFIEPINLTLRSHLPALARKALSFARRSCANKSA